MDTSSPVAECFLAHMERGLTQIGFLSQYPGVKIPSYLQNQPVTLLNFSYNFGLEDLEITDSHISATLSFRGRPHHVVVPFAGIVAVGVPGGPFMEFISEIPTAGTPAPADTTPPILRLVSFNPDIPPAVSKAPLRLVVDNSKNTPDTPPGAAA